MKSKVLIFGDICPTEDYRNLFDTSKFFSVAIIKEIEKNDIVIANFECPATGNQSASPKCGPSLKAEPKDVERLKGLGFNVLSLANNHILDYGAQGTEETLILCKQAGIQTVGAGVNREEASKPIILESKGERIGIRSFAEEEFNLAGDESAGANGFDPYTSYDDVRELKKQCDYLIVLYHGGIEHYKYPSPLLQKKCRKFVECGADLVLCQHSHCIGTKENHAGGTIIYGQGNSVFGYRKGNKAWNEGLLISISDQSVNMRLMLAKEDGITFADEKTNNNRIDEMIADSKQLNDPKWIEQKWREYALTQADLDMPLLYGRSRVFNKLNRITKGFLIKILYGITKQRITMNLIRCDAHREVVKTILETKVFE